MKILRILIFSLGFLFSSTVFSSTCVLTSTGNWETAGNWSCGRVPTCGDSVVIPALKTATITTQLDYSTCGGPIAINIFGTLDFNNGKKISLACGSLIYVQVTGAITGGGGGGSSNLISICGNTAWTSGQGNVGGPSTVSSGGVSSGLPVELLYFYVNKTTQASAKLTWATATETDNKGFEIQRSVDGTHFETSGWVNAQGNGNSLMTLLYEYQDLHPYSGTSYYRLKQMDKNGAYKIYPAQQFINRGGAINIYPNPAKDQLIVEGVNESENATLTIVNTLGMEVLSITLSSASSVIDINALPAGVYSVIMEKLTETNATRLVIQK